MEFYRSQYCLNVEPILDIIEHENKPPPKAKYRDTYSRGVRTLSIPRLRQSRKNAYAHLNLKITAIYVQAVRLIRRIESIKSTYEQCVNMFTKMEKPYDPFVWLKVDWKARYQFQMVWLSILEAHSTELCLETYKMHTDCDELIKCLVAILDPYLQRHNKQQILLHHFQTRIEKGATYSYEFVQDKFLRQQSRLSCKLRKYRAKYNAFAFIGAVLCKVRDAFKKRILDYLTTARITDRYIVNYNAVCMEQVDLANHIKEQKLQDEIANYKKRIAEEQYVIQCTLDMHFTTIETLRQRFSAMQTRYETELHNLAENAHHLRNKMRGQKEKHLFMIELMAHYRTEMARPGSKDFDYVLRQNIRVISAYSFPKLSKLGRTTLSGSTARSKSIQIQKSHASLHGRLTNTADESSLNTSSSELDLTLLRASLERKLRGKSGELSARNTRSTIATAIVGRLSGRNTTLVERQTNEDKN